MAAGLGYVVVPGSAELSGVVEEPPEPLDPPEPSFGQSALVPPAGRSGVVDGAVPSTDGSVTLGQVEVLGSGLAAETTATAPPTRSSAETAAASTARWTPVPFALDARVASLVTGSAGVAQAGLFEFGGDAIGVSGAGRSGGVFGSIT